MNWMVCLIIWIYTLIGSAATAQTPGDASWVQSSSGHGEPSRQDARTGAMSIASEFQRLRRANPDIYEAFFARAVGEVHRLTSVDPFFACDYTSCFDGVAYQFFQGADGVGAFYWHSRETYGLAIPVYGAFLTYWANAGYERGTLGLPLDREQTAGGACAREGAARQQSFQGQRYGFTETMSFDDPTTVLCWSPERGVWATFEQHP